MPPQLSFWFPGSGPTPGEGEAVHITGKTLFLVFFLRMEGLGVLTTLVWRLAGGLLFRSAGSSRGGTVAVARGPCNARTPRL